LPYWQKEQFWRPVPLHWKHCRLLTALPEPLQLKQVLFPDPKHCTQFACPMPPQFEQIDFWLTLTDGGTYPVV
jgi:hypothetical protein